MKATYDSFEYQIEEEYNRTQRLTSTLSLAPVHTGIKNDDIWVDVFDNIDKTVECFKNVQNDTIDKIKEIENAIAKLDSPIEQSILTMHYLENLPFSEITKRVPYSERSVYNYHASALEHIIMPDDNGN